MIPKEIEIKIHNESMKEHPREENDKTWTASNNSIASFCRGSFKSGGEYGYSLAQEQITNLKKEIDTLNTDYSEEVKKSEELKSLLLSIDSRWRIAEEEVERLNHIIENFGV